jgi:antirestriction protein ArdC
MAKKFDGPKPEEVLVQDLIALMEQGKTPWRKEWNAQASTHVNFLTGHKYSGSNIILLEFGMCLREGAVLPFWCGAAEARKHNVFPKKGSRSVRIIRPQLNKREEENDNGETVEKTWMSFKIVPVFNVCDLQGEALPSLIQAAKDELGFSTTVSPSGLRIQNAESFLNAWPVKLKHQGSRAFYSPSEDFISLPEFELFHSAEAYYSTRAHECIHSTGHQRRLDRKISNNFGSKDYAFEELVAELGSVLLCNQLQISSNFSNHAAYLQSWIEILKEKPSTLFQALSYSRKAVEFMNETIAKKEELIAA